MAYSQEFKIPEVICDKNGNLSIRNLISLMVEVSTNQAHIVEKGLDMSRLRWIVYSWDVELKGIINAQDEIIITTYPIKMDRFYAHRNIEVTKNGRTIARAYAVLMIVDIDRMRPIKIKKEIEAAYKIDQPIFEKQNLSYKDNFDKSKEIMTRYTDIDSNLHVNNAVYFDYICDLCKLDTKDIKFMNIVYNTEIRNKNSVMGEYVEEKGEIDYRLKSIEDDTIYTYGKIIKNV